MLVVSNWIPESYVNKSPIVPTWSSGQLSEHIIYKWRIYSVQEKNLVQFLCWMNFYKLLICEKYNATEILMSMWGIWRVILQNCQQTAKCRRPTVQCRVSYFYQGRWFVCFVFSFVMMRSPTPRPHVLASVGKSLVSVPVHLSGLVVFRPPMQELLSIEQFCWRKFNKIETKYFKEIKALEALDEWDFLEVIL